MPPRVNADERRRELVTQAADLFDRSGYHTTNVAAGRGGGGSSQADPLPLLHEQGRDPLLDPRGVHRPPASRAAARRRCPAGPKRSLEIMADMLELMETHRGHVRVFFEHHRELALEDRADDRDKRDVYQDAGRARSSGAASRRRVPRRRPSADHARAVRHVQLGLPVVRAEGPLTPREIAERSLRPAVPWAARGESVRTADQYLDGLRDGREVYYRGERVEDVVAHPELGSPRGTARSTSPAGPSTETSPYRHSTYYPVPRSAADLRARSALIEESTRRGRTLVVLIKEIGTDALFALHRVTHGTDGATTASERLLRALPRRRPGAGGRPRPTSRATARRRRAARTTPTSTCGSSTGATRASWCAAPRCTPRAPPNVDEMIVIPTRALAPRRGGLGGRVRRPGRDTGPEALLLGLPRSGDARRRRPPRLLQAQDDRDPDRVRRRVRALGAGLPAPATRRRRAALRSDLRRVPPLHRRLLQAPARRRASSGSAARSPRRTAIAAGLARPRQAHPR